MTEKYGSVLNQIAVVEGVDIANLFVENDIVFRCDGGELIGAVCQIGTPLWSAAQNAAELLNRVKK